MNTQNMVFQADDAAVPGEALAWRLLNIVNLFRMVVGGLVVALFFSDSNPRLLGDVYPGLFLWTGIMYFSFGGLATFTVRSRRPGLELQTYAQLAADITAVTLLMHSSGGGAASGLGSLMFITVSINSVLLSRRMSIAFAALATIAILGEQGLAILYGTGDAGGYTQAGIIGIIMFAASWGGQFVGHRLRESEALAERRGLDLADLSEINEYVLQHMRTGVLVVDEQDRIRMLNSAAAESLRTPPDSRDALQDAAPRLQGELQAWRRGDLTRPATVVSPQGRPLIPHFASIGRNRAGGVLIFLEDASAVAEQVRQMKLATLGRLTASIAHEIRNPLAAVSHANQLLAESPQIKGKDQRLIEIIEEHSERMERIVENILQLSRRENTRAEELDVTAWLKDFITEFRERHGLPPEAVPLDAEYRQLPRMRVDPTHLHQIVLNLSENALHHGRRGHDGGTRIEFRIGPLPAPASGFLEVLDRGPGVPADIAEHIFEPFYTSDPRGTGLGLFIARELCECNRARLSYAPRPQGGSCFRIEFGASEGWLT
ncbi:MAG TPA: HAMP domain-containing sensor histidine kinase [Gammaproteobacteria bacterium]|jgi:two-component system sensor histidine kinase PilS (NtrC family)|nr:HAMP domain-containing sensor histidine kinase [Gammaproteobacteria bacterium]